MTRSGERALGASAGTASRLDHAARWLAVHPPATPLLIVATDLAAADALVRRVVAEQGAARFGCERLSLGQLARRLALPALARAGRVVASPLAFEAVVARALHRVAEADGLGRLRVLHGHPGLVRAAAA